MDLAALLMPEIKPAPGQTSGHAVANTDTVDLRRSSVSPGMVYVEGHH